MAREDNDGRRDPDRLLKAIEASDEHRHDRRGHLKIFFGYSAGVGKTYAMLTAAQAARRRGVDVVAGYVEPHARPETSALLAGLERIPPARCGTAVSSSPSSTSTPRSNAPPS